MRQSTKAAVGGSAASGAAAVLSAVASCCGAGCLGACGVVCIVPVASLLGVTAAAVFASPVWRALQPVLIAVSAVSFTVAYYSLFGPAAGRKCVDTSCDCPDSSKKKSNLWPAKVLFFASLFLSIGLFVYSQYAAPSLSHETTQGCEAQSGCGTTQCESEKGGAAQCGAAQGEKSGAAATGKTPAACDAP